RALRVMDVLVKTLEKRGYDVSPGPKGNRLNVSVLGESISIWLEELITITERQLKPAEIKDREKNPWKYRRPEYIHTPNGRLAFRLDVDCFVQGIRRSWTDAEKHRVESSINDFIVGMVRAAERHRAERLEKERWRREQQAEQERRIAEQRRLEEER